VASRSRKRRQGARTGVAAEAARSPAGLADPPAEPTFTERYRARTEARNEEIRAHLEPLAPGERPREVTVAACVALVIAAINLVAALTGNGIVGDEGQARMVTAVWIGILVLTGIGMLLRQYWAVLGFEILLGVQICAFTLALVVVEKIWVAALLVVLTGSFGVLFWKLVRPMARMQMPRERTGAGVQ
jgi:hypothetical protein